MKIRDKFIDSVKSGDKKREYRLNDEARRQVKPGDILVLISTINSKKFVRVKVISRHNYPNWKMALEDHWLVDFKGIYSTIEEALKDCNRFYRREEVEKYGIVTFDIIPENIPLKNSVVLLDTNIIIQRESSNNVTFEVAELYRWLDNLGCKKVIHSATKQEISKYADKKILENMLCKLNAYGNINECKEEQKDFFEVTKLYPLNENSRIDNSLLLQVYAGKVDYLVTNDKEMLRKSDALYIRDHVVSTVEFLRKFEEAFPKLIEYRMLRVKKVLFSDVNYNSHV